MDNTDWQTDLEAYIRQGEPDKAERTNVWRTAIGLQDVDGLKTSDYLLETARAHIEGEISILDADRRIQG
ncbi:MAG: antitoxin VbhA family protein, partial [Lachnospiraceae bacterium]|nr:antitoxin VbhA family protein [Lachnospiraceae bacterium]